MARSFRLPALLALGALLSSAPLVRADDDAPPAKSSALESDFAAMKATFEQVKREKDQAARQKLLGELRTQTRGFLDAHRAEAAEEQLNMAAQLWLELAQLNEDWPAIEAEIKALRGLPKLPKQLDMMLTNLETTLPGRPAPAWKAKDIHTGEEVTLEGLRGKLVLVDFWATWCPPCRSLMAQHLQPLHQAYAGREAEFELIGMGVPWKGDTPEKEVEFAEKQGYKWRKVFDASGEAPKAYGVNGIPTLVLVDPDGKILVAGSGWAVIEKVKKVLAERLGAPAAPADAKPAEEPQKD